MFSLVQYACVWYSVHMFGTVCMCLVWYRLHVSSKMCICLVQSTCVWYSLHVFGTVCMCLVQCACVSYSVRVWYSLHVFGTKNVRNIRLDIGSFYSHLHCLLQSSRNDFVLHIQPLLPCTDLQQNASLLCKFVYLYQWMFF